MILFAALALAMPAGAGCSNSRAVDGSRHGRWTVVFTGYGDVSAADSTVTLAPRAAADHDLTHGALVVDTDVPSDVRLSATITTTEQLRVGGHPNPWEVGWVLWRYTDPDHFYAIVLKPNGWELSKQDPAYPGKQRFLASGTTPTFPIGRPHSVEVTHVGSTIVVHAAGRLLTQFTDTERPYPRGGLALYTEDARVTFTDIVVGSAGPGDLSPPPGG